MSRPWIHWSVAVILLGFGGSPLAAATPFSLTPTFDVEIGNDGQIGPGNASETGTGMGIRNVATRRRVSYATYDLTGLRGPGQVFLNVSLSNYGHDPGTVNVYGVLESVEHLVGPGINWNNAPGVKNDPTPALDTDVVLDPRDLTGILLTFNAPARGVRASTDTSQALADFLSSDTDGFVALLFAPEGAGNAIVRTIEMGAEGGSRLQGEVGGQLYAKIDGKKATYTGAKEDLKKAAWVQWSIDLSFLGADLKNVKSLIVGVEGAGAVGTLFFDDIQLRP